ncbi:hypothetical protein AF332_27825 [Sporosarcina globispora]|uniref:Uncharacterized protein n=1 Tax=Sporosarcina globispora TaxID=1459 RepID=A0A0M0G271_SPOGL|nr:hypothetical protein [Sporosarcina globispora]KON83556.1 hypothetical protein AF332_27825 [Sporosarcina globispora]
MRVIEKKRKVRSDKKRDVKPSLSIKLKECIHRLSYITNTPVKDVAEKICESGVTSNKVMDHLSQFFRRDIRLNNTMYLGDLERESLQRRNKTVKERITIRFSQSTYDDLCSLAYALDVTPTKATALLLEASIKNSEFVHEYIEEYIGSYLDEGRMKELKKVMKFINENNPYDEEFSWAEFIDVLFNEIKVGTSTIKNALTDWIDRNKIE